VRHWYINENAAINCSHYAVGHNEQSVLLQLGDNKGEQVRLALTAAQADHIVTLLLQHRQQLLDEYK
jgi:tRNA pseudouridine-54 N-methylase